MHYGTVERRTEGCSAAKRTFWNAGSYRTGVFFALCQYIYTGSPSFLTPASRTSMGLRRRSYEQLSLRDARIHRLELTASETRQNSLTFSSVVSRISFSYWASALSHASGGGTFAGMGYWNAGWRGSGV